MLVVFGAYAGQAGRIVQFANDWITVDLDSGQHTDPLPPTSIELTTDEERRIFEQSRHSHHVGEFWNMWELRDDGRFTRIGPEPVPSYAGRGGRRSSGRWPRRRR